jgi:hypothetical protein
MFSIHDRGSELCDGLTRREWLRVGGIGLGGLSLPHLLQAAASKTPAGNGSFGRAKRCIVLYLSGGPPQHETWDPKPDAPAEIRGEFRPIASSVPGLWVGELMPRVARLVHHCSVLRSVSTADNAHASSMYWMLTGQPHVPPNVEGVKLGPPNDWPCFASVIGRLRAGRAALPAAVTLPEQMIGNDFSIPPGQNAGFLGRAADPWLLTCDPSAPDFRVPALEMPAELPPLRVDGRFSLLEQVNRRLDAVDSGSLSQYGHYRQQALDLLRSARGRRAFALEEETAIVRDRYGHHKFGQSVLLARRLVEAGVALVQVNWPREKGDMKTDNPCWDTHTKNSERLKAALMPPMDLAYSALLEDLQQRGLLDETLVVWMGEFGRTPKINARGGRDHWGHVFSVALAGGGIRGGQVVGASDRSGAQPRERPIQPQDFMATVFHCLGIRAEAEIRDRLGRPVPVSRGRAIEETL